MLSMHSLWKMRYQCVVDITLLLSFRVKKKKSVKKKCKKKKKEKKEGMAFSCAGKNSDGDLGIAGFKDQKTLYYNEEHKDLKSIHWFSFFNFF